MANEFQVVVNELDKEMQFDLQSCAQNRAFKMALTRTITMLDKELASLQHGGDHTQFAFDYMQIKQRKEFATEMLNALTTLNEDIQREIQNAQNEA